MKKITLLFAIIAFAFTSIAQIKPVKIATDNKLKTGLDSLVDQSLSKFMEGSSRVGISIGIIKNGSSYLYNYGSTQSGSAELPTGNTIYELASITKTFGATLLAGAVLDKKIDLQDDMQKYLKEAYPNLNYNGTPITILNLVNLTSGLPNWMPDKDIFGNATPDAIPHILDSVHRKYSRQDFYHDLHHVKLTVLPGTVARHCNTAAQLVGFIMEGIYNSTYDKLLKTHFTDPLHMKHTFLIKHGKQPALMAKGYNGEGKLMPVTDWEDLSVAASIASTASDMLKYMAFQLDETNPVVKLSHQPTFGKIEDGAIALNWKVKTTAQGNRSVSHTGGSLGFSSYLVFYPDLKTGIVLLANDAAPDTQNELIALSGKILEL